MKMRFLFPIVFSIFISLFFSTIASAQNNLAPGDIAVVSYQSDFDQTNTFDPLVPEFEDRFSIAILRPGGLAAGTVIYFTDRGWDGPNNTWLDNATVGREAVIKWIVPAGGIAQGTEVYFINTYHDELGAGNEIYTWGAYSSEAGTTLLGVVTTETTLPVSGMDFTVSGDNLLIYQTGPAAGPAGTFSATPIRFITALLANLVANSTNSTGWDATPVTLNESTIPPGLINGQSAFVMSPATLPTATVNSTSEPDNGKYNCVNSNGVACTALALSTFIYTTTNWDYNNTQYGVGLTSNHCTYAVVPAITINAPTVTQPTCATPTGTIVVNATGTGTLEYSLNGGAYQTSSTFSGLAPGNYNISVRSQTAPSCVTVYANNPVVINTAPAGPIVSAPTVTQPTCATPTGTIVVNASGSGTLEYSLNGGSWQTSNSFSGLAPGNYNISVRLQSTPDCESSYSGNPVVINEAPSVPVVNAPTVTQPTCAEPTGTIVVNASGSGTLEYSLNGGSWQTSNTFSDLTPGNYNIAVRLQSNTACATNYSGNPVVINAPPSAPVVNAPTVTQPTCAEPTGTIVVNASGSGTLEYSLNGGSWQTSNTFSDLTPGNYNIAVRLQSNTACATNYSGNPVVINAIPSAPVVNTPTVTQPTCGTPTGTIVVNASGSGILEYSLNGGSWQTSNSFSGLAPDNYNISVRLQSTPDCESSYSGNPVVINAAPSAPVVNAPTVTQPTCAEPTGTIVVNAGGSGTLEYSLNGGSWQTSNAFSGLAPGNYNIAVRSQAEPTCVTNYSGNPVVLNAPTGCTVPPTIDCPDNIITTATSGQCSKSVSFTVTATGTPTPTVVSKIGSTVITSPYTFPVGTTTVNCTATNVAGTASCSFTVTVNDNQPPVINTNPSPIVLLWSPNHKYQKINASQCVTSVTDNCGSISVSNVVITHVTSDEVEDAAGNGDGITTDDMKIAANCKSVDLRRERMEGGNGRVYTIHLKVTDINGNVATASCKVVAPPNQGGTTAVDNGPVYTEFGSCYVASRSASLQLLTMDTDEVINEFTMAQNYPNPFRTITSIRYALPAEANVSLEVYNQVGQRVAILAEGRQSAGYHQARFDATNLAAGIYLYRLLTVDADGKPVLITKKMIVAK